MIALALGILVVCHSAVSFPRPGPNPFPGPVPGPNAFPGPAPRPVPIPAPVANPDPYFGGGLGYGGLGYGYGGCVEEVITPPVIPPVLNTVDVFDIATLGVIPAPPIEYVYPAVGYEAFGLGCNGGHAWGGWGPGYY